MSNLRQLNTDGNTCSSLFALLFVFTWYEYNYKIYIATVYYLLLHTQVRLENETTQSTDRFQVGALEKKGRNILIKLGKFNQIKHTKRKSENKLKTKRRGLINCFVTRFKDKIREIVVRNSRVGNTGCFP